MIENKLSWLIGGEAGYGIMRAGMIFAKTTLKGELYVFVNNEYPSLIRGGHNTVKVRVDSEEIHSQIDHVDLLVALNEETIKLHLDELHDGSGIIYDSEVISIDNLELPENVKLFGVPLLKIVRELGAKPIVRNTVSLGVSIGILDYDLSVLQDVLSQEFKASPEVVEINKAAAKAGYDFVKKHYDNQFEFKLKKLGEKSRYLISGNEAVALGAIRAGLKLYSAYPMTPASSIMHYLAAKQMDYDFVVFQAESEIAAINMITGAAFAGIRAMTGTSGGGFSLMVEALGLAAMTESPIVVVVSQRPGPSTGLATRTAQGDLRFVLHASQGEFPRFVVAPGDVNEAFYYTAEMFNLVEKYQVPGIILIDKYLSESSKATDKLEVDKIKIERGKLFLEENKRDYKRYEITEDWVSPRAIPGLKGTIFRVTGDEHDEYGYTIEEEDLTTKMVDKRFRKLKHMVEEIKKLNPVKIYGDKNSENVLIFWGSTKGPVLEAYKFLKKEGISIKLVQILFMSPFPAEEVNKEISSARNRILIEMNKTGLLGSLIREHNFIEIENNIRKYGGRPFNPLEIVERVKEVI
ncbi:MAG: 2-oxoacid:acceptor oxidoreductase subunit alpha [Candidatus Asgardarchaeia archaeon]